jgi:hypothetical protein
VVVLQITDFNVKTGFRGSFLSGKTKTGTELRLVLRPETVLRKISPIEVNQGLGEIFRQTASLPFRIGQEVLVEWDVDSSLSLPTARKITVLE